MARTTQVTKKIVAVIADCSFGFLILNLFDILLGIHAVDSGDLMDDNATESPGCPNGYFPCYLDCCMMGEWYCHEREERCRRCSTWEQYCAHELLPRDCLLYCYKLLNPPTVGGYSDENVICIPWPIFIAVLSLVLFIVVAIISAAVMMWVCLRRTPLHKWPVCVRPQISSEGGNGEDPIPAEEEHLMADNAAKDIHIGEANDHSSASSLPTFSTSSLSHNSTHPADMETLNLTSVNPDGDAEQTAPHRQLDGEGSLPSQQNRPADSVEGPQSLAQTRSSSEERSTRPQQGHDPDRGHGDTCGSDESNGGPSSRNMPGISSEGRTPSHQGPDPSRDIEVRPDRSPNSKALTRDHGVHEDSALRAGGHQPPPPPPLLPPQGRQTGFPGDAGPSSNEVYNKPDFSKMTPTPDGDSQQHRVIALDTSNPVHNYRQCTMQNQPRPLND